MYIYKIVTRYGNDAVDIRGLFLAALVHHDGRILVTGDDIVPMIDVDSEFSSASLSADLYWLMKVLTVYISGYCFLGDRNFHLV